MKSVNEIERWIKRIRIGPNTDVDDRIVALAEAALDRSKKTKSGMTKCSIWRRNMRSRIRKIVAAALIVAAVIIAIQYFDGSVELVPLSKAAPVIWPVTNGGNGHFYLPIATPYPISWSDANAVADLLGGHLVTIESAEENDFVFNLIDDDIYWYPSVNLRGPWIGGYQLPGSSEPSGGWTWITGEPFTYTNWDLGQPNNYQGHGNQGKNENRIHFGNKPVRVPTWNDVTLDYDEIRAYVVELSEPDQLPVEWPIADGGNGHLYLAVTAPGGITWVEANRAANLAGGHLATITSAEENNFVTTLIDNEKYWIEYSTDTSVGPWIGGYQLPGSLEPDGGWRWVIDEPFAFAKWGQEKPDNSPDEGTDENCLHFLRLMNRRGCITIWNDLPDDYAGVHGYVIEFSRLAKDIPGDLNSDGIVDSKDFSIFASHWLERRSGR